MFQVIVFEEPGVKLKHKVEGKGDNLKVIRAREQRINAEVKKIYDQEREEGNALPAVIKELQLTKTLR